MIKIYLFCSNGMSTSILAQRMQEYADSQNISVVVKAKSDALMDKIVSEEKPNIILLGPQVEYIYNDTKEKYLPQGIPVMVIPYQMYGLMDGESVLNLALKEI